MVVGVLGRGIVAAEEPVVRADDLGLARGDGCFESCRVLTDAAGHSVVERLDAHLYRLQRSLDSLDIPADVRRLPRPGRTGRRSSGPRRVRPWSS